MISGIDIPEHPGGVILCGIDVDRSIAVRVLGLMRAVYGSRVSPVVVPEMRWIRSVDMHARTSSTISCSRVPIALNPSEMFFQRMGSAGEDVKKMIDKELAKGNEEDFAIVSMRYDPVITVNKEKGTFSKWTGCKAQGLCIIANSDKAWNCLYEWLGSNLSLIAESSFRVYFSGRKTTQQQEQNGHIFMCSSSSLSSQLVKGHRLAHKDQGVRSVVLVVPRRTKAGHIEILILRRGKTAPWKPGVWSLPGGVVEKGESVLIAGLRELKEETDLEPISASILGKPYYSGPGTYCMQAVLVNVDNFHKLGKSSSFPGGLPVNEDIGIPENDEWKFIDRTQIDKFEQCSDANLHILSCAFSILGTRSSI